MKKMETYLPLQVIQEYSELALLSWNTSNQDNALYIILIHFFPFSRFLRTILIQL